MAWQPARIFLAAVRQAAENFGVGCREFRGVLPEMSCPNFMAAGIFLPGKMRKRVPLEGVKKVTILDCTRHHKGISSVTALGF